MIGAVDVGDGHGDRRAEHQCRGDLLGPLVDGAGREDVAGAKGLEERPEIQLPAEVVDRRVPDVGAERRPAVGGHDGAENPAGLGEGLVPADFHEAPVAPHHRRPQPVRVLVEVLEGRALGAEVAAAPHVVAVTPDADDLVGGRQPDLEPAARLAQRADSQGGAGDGRCGGPGGQVNPPGHQSAAVTPVVSGTGVCPPLRR